MTLLDRLQESGIVSRFLPSWGRVSVGDCATCRQPMESVAGYDGRMRPMCGWCVVEAQDAVQEGIEWKYTPERRASTRWRSQGAQGVTWEPGRTET